MIPTAGILGRQPTAQNCVQRCLSEAQPDLRTLNPWYQNSHGENSCVPGGPLRSGRLYWGATIDKPVEGMFSFFPCQLAEMSPRGFARPGYANPMVIKDNLSQGKRFKPYLSQTDVKKFWNEVRLQVESADLSLGVFTEAPGRRNK